ncbi:MAG: ABC transporter permease [Myxococcales bacterium]|nr:ABC transporter permease [Myxococcales bacterium]
MYELQIGWRYLYAGHREPGLVIGLVLSLLLAALGLGLVLALGSGHAIGVVLLLIGLVSAAVFGLLSLLSVSSAVAVLGVVLGVAALTVVLSVTTGFQDQFRDKVLGVNAHVIIMKSSTDFAEYRDVMDIAKSIDPDVVAVQPFNFLELLATTGHGRISGVAVKGVDPELVTSVLDLEKHMIAGDLATLKVKSSATVLPNIIVGKELARKLRIGVGDDVTIVVPLSNVDFETWRTKAAAPKTRRFRVSGIFYSGFEEYDRRLMYTSLAETQVLTDRGDRVMGVELKVKDVDRASQIAAKLRKRLGEPPFQVQDWYELNHNLFKALTTQKLVLLIVLTLIIAVATVNLVSALTMMVTDRVREIAILKSMGAQSKGIGVAFVVVGGAIGVLGTVVGIGLGVATCVVVRGYGYRLDPKVYLIDRLPISMRPSEILLVAGITMALCLIATLIPTIKAANLRPVVGLRED